MINIKIMYWKEIPVQILVENSSIKRSIELDQRFQQAVDAIAMFDGSMGTDEYLDGWQWIESKSNMTLEIAIDKLTKYYNEGIPENFVSKIRDQIKNGSRNESPGSIEKWINYDKPI
tara:strand:- start:333 stop:683 length:351 start_codon:yes stop_codon:yes gene_type:complete